MLRMIAKVKSNGYLYLLHVLATKLGFIHAQEAECINKKLAYHVRPMILC